MSRSVTQALKRAARRLPHGLPIARRIDLLHDIGDQNAAAQGYAQVMDRLGRQGPADVCVLLKDSIHPIREPDFFCDGRLRLRHDENQRPS